MKKKCIRVLLIILLITNYIVIFNFSSQVGDESSSLSTCILRKILNFFGLIDNAREFTYLEFIIRKFAHFLLYFTCGIFLYTITLTININDKNRILVSFFINLLYSVSDEIHQLFVVGRTGKITDVFIDSFGILCGVLIVFGIRKICFKIKNKNVS